MMRNNNQYSPFLALSIVLSSIEIEEILEFSDRVKFASTIGIVVIELQT